MWTIRDWVAVTRHSGGGHWRPTTTWLWLPTTGGRPPTTSICSVIKELAGNSNYGSSSRSLRVSEIFVSSSNITWTKGAQRNILLQANLKEIISHVSTTCLSTYFIQQKLISTIWTYVYQTLLTPTLRLLTPLYGTIHEQYQFNFIFFLLLSIFIFKIYFCVKK